jgi:hypothetical protein
MHTLGQRYENEQKAIRPHDFRPSSTVEPLKQTAPQPTAPTPMRYYDLSLYRSGGD